MKRIKLIVLVIAVLFSLPGWSDGGKTSGVLNPWNVMIGYNPKMEAIEVYSIEDKKRIVHGTESYRFPLEGKVKASCEKSWKDWYYKQARAKEGTLINQRETAKENKQQVRVIKEGRRLRLMPPPGSQAGRDIAMEAVAFRADMLMNKVEELSSNPSTACPKLAP